MKLFTVVEEGSGELIHGSPQYPMWISKEPDIYVAEAEYSEEAYKRIRAEADLWRIDLDRYQEDDHGYDQKYSYSDAHNRPIKDEEILVKDGAFFGIIAFVNRSFYSMNPEFFERYEYVSVNTAEIRHGLWQYHYGHSSDNSSSSSDTVYYLHSLA